MKYRKRPVVVEAVQFHGGIREIPALVGMAFPRTVTFRPERGDYGSAIISTLEGEMEARPGDWIIKGVQGECYPCKPDIFAATYEPVEDDA